MNFLPEDELIWSPIVVNSRMNRERNVSGINSYEQEFGFKPELWLEDRVKTNGEASWLDLCCGQGKALIQTAVHFHKLGLQDKVHLTGIDLVNTFLPVDDAIHCLELKEQSLMNGLPDKKYDLITCVHGLHYIGDKLKVIEQAAAFLKDDGLFMANFDVNNIAVENAKGLLVSSAFVKKTFKECGLDYSVRRKVLQRKGFGDIHFDVSYMGANDAFGPNYTGQDSVTSHYKILSS